MYFSFEGPGNSLKQLFSVFLSNHVIIRLKVQQLRMELEVMASKEP